MCRFPAVIFVFLLFGVFPGCGEGSHSTQPWPASVPPRHEDNLAAIARGKTVVRALYAYHNEYGLWPMTLEELAPDYLDSAALYGWVYHWHPRGSWNLTDFTGYPFAAVRLVHNRN